MRFYSSRQSKEEQFSLEENISLSQTLEILGICFIR